ncbi:MAG: molybdopterin molybdenumtransferase MoeA, partial [Chloroflexota bacterium]
MPEFLQLLSPPDALNRLLAHLPVDRSGAAWEEIETRAALGRVTAAPVIASHPLPPFSRSAVDGYALRAADTFGANDGLPAYLQLVAEIPMGAPADIALHSGQCALIHTGGMLPEPADAVVMVEHTQRARPEEVEILRAVAVGENVIHAGEDVACGQQVIPKGFRLRPAEIGGLMALGLTRLQVACRPVAGILSTGDEIVPPEAEPRPGQVRDVNTYTLSALVESAGCEAKPYGIVPDHAAGIRQSAEQALEECDLVIITAGSSASVRDL